MKKYEIRGTRYCTYETIRNGKVWRVEFVDSLCVARGYLGYENIPGDATHDILTEKQKAEIRAFLPTLDAAYREYDGPRVMRLPDFDYVEEKKKAYAQSCRLVRAWQKKMGYEAVA